VRAVRAIGSTPPAAISRGLETSKGVREHALQGDYPQQWLQLASTVPAPAEATNIPEAVRVRAVRRAATERRVRVMG
jgi:hypothetical protein